MTDAVIEVQSVHAGYVADLPILHDVSLRAEKATVTLIIGPNGAGKSTLIKAIAGLVNVFKGNIYAGGKDITHMRPDQMARHGIAYVPQTDNIFRQLSVRQNLALALRKHVNAGAKLEQLLNQFPILKEKLPGKAGSLSGGQRQFLAVAMALATDPHTLLLDEPSAGLSPRAAQEVLEQARSLTDEGVTILLVEQNVNQALKLADNCYILAEGRNQVMGTAAELLDNKVVADIYLGGRRLKANT